MALSAYLLFVFGGAALLAPWLYILAQQFPFLDELAKNPFHRFLNRALLILALAGMYPLIRALGVKSWKEAGLNFSTNWGKQWLGGFGLGLGSLFMVALLATIIGPRDWNFAHTSADYLNHFANAIFAALIVSILEELLFRGAIYTGLRKVHGWFSALIFSSTVYAIVHFFNKPPPPESIHWWTGFATLGEMLRGFADFDQLVPGFLSLTLAGIILAQLYDRTGFLFASIGLHAGWIFWLKSYNFLTVYMGTGSAWLWGSSKLTDGWSALAVLTLMMILLGTVKKDAGTAK